MQRIKWLCALGVVVLLSACSSVNSMLGGNSKDEALNAIHWSHAADGVHIQVKASPQLNTYQGQAHMLTLAVAQMESSSAFSEQTGTAAGIRTLLLAQGVPSGLLALNHLYIAPGEQRTLVLPRLEKAQYIGLVAGYDHLEPANTTRLYGIGVQLKSTGLVVKTRRASPEPLDIQLHLGPTSIVGAPAKARDLSHPPKPSGGLIQPTPVQHPPVTTQDP